MIFKLNLKLSLIREVELELIRLTFSLKTKIAIKVYNTASRPR